MPHPGVRAALATAGALLIVVPTLAGTPPIPKVMSDAPPDKGSWKMEILSLGDRPPPPLAGRSGNAITLCVTAAQAMDDHHADRPGKSDCDTKLVEDSDSRAVLETVCRAPVASRSRATITREAPRSYLVSTQVEREGRSNTTQFRMSYAGACSASDSVVSFGKDSPMCREALAKLGDDPSRCTGAEREQCERSIARLRQMCR